MRTRFHGFSFHSYNAIRGCRWVDEVVEDVPYITRNDVTRGHNIGAPHIQ